MPVEIDKLEGHLWEAANILRGPVDAADFKTYVFPLLFFKRISDVHDEEHAAALAEADGDEEYVLFPQNYRRLPAGRRRLRGQDPFPARSAKLRKRVLTPFAGKGS